MLGALFVLRFRVFLSAITFEFGEYREKLHNYLRAYQGLWLAVMTGASNAKPPKVFASRDCVCQRSICTDTARQYIRFDYHPAIELSPLQHCHDLWKIDVPLAQRSKDSVPDRMVEIQFLSPRFGRFVLVNVFEVYAPDS